MLLLLLVMVVLLQRCGRLIVRYVGGVHQPTRSVGDVRLDLALCRLHVLGRARHLENGFLVARGRDDVGVCLLLDALDGRPLGSHHQPHHAVWHSHPDGDLARAQGRAGGAHTAITAEAGGAGAAARGPDLREVRRGVVDFLLGGANVLAPTRDHEDWFLPSDGGLDVCVCFGSQGLDFAA